MADDNEDEVELDPAVLLVPALLPGDRCRVFIGGGEGSGSTGALDSDQQAKLKAKADKGVGRSALVKYVGQVPGMPRGYWIGVQYDEKVGKNDGMLNGRRFFRCPAGHGGFVRSTKVVKVDPPQTSEAAAPPAPPATVPPGAPPVEGGATTGATPTGGSPSPPKPRLPIEGRLEEVAGTAISDPSFDRYDLLTPHGPNGSESPTRADGSMASRIARRRKELATQRSQRSTRSPLEMRGKRTMCQLTLSEWQERVAPLRADGSATPTQTYATGPELEKAVVGTLAQFTILARSAAGEQVAKGGDNIEVVMRGIGGANNSQPALLHTKIIDRGDGSYICEFRPWLTGTFGVWITLDGCNITGSPYEVCSRCGTQAMRPHARPEAARARILCGVQPCSGTVPALQPTAAAPRCSLSPSLVLACYAYVAHAHASMRCDPRVLLCVLWCVCARARECVRVCVRA